MTISYNAIDVKGRGPSDDGSGYRIADGYVLTAGHVAFFITAVLRVV
jgi:hypothetical protein